MNNIIESNNSYNKVTLKYKYLAYLILLYPSIPYFNIGWGSNIPFFIVSLIIIYLHIQERKTFYIDKVFYIPLWSFLTIAISVIIIYYRLSDFNFKLLFVGLREFIIKISILYSIYIVYKKISFNIFLKGLLLGVYINFLYGFLELLFPTITLHDSFFHNLGKEVYRDYFINGTADRIRLLWTEPSMAGIYMLFFALPLGFIIKKQRTQLTYLILWVFFFFHIFSKGIILFFFITIILYSIINIKKTLYILFKPYFLIMILFTVLFLLFNDNFLDKMLYIFNILFVLLDNFINGNFNIISILSNTDSISFSQGGRFVQIYVVLNIFFHDFYTLITGFTPYGYSYFKYFNYDLIPNSFFGLMKFDSYSSMFYSKQATQSGILELYSYYGLPIVIFLTVILRRYYDELNKSFLIKKQYIVFYFIWFLFSIFFMLFYHILPILVTLYLLFKNYNKSLRRI